MKSTFSWLTSQQNGAQQFQIHPNSPSSATANLKVEKPTLNSVIIQNSKQPMQNTSTTSINLSPQRVSPKISRIVRNTNQPELPKQYSLETVADKFENEVTFNETDINSLGIDLNSEDALLPNLKSIVSELPLGGLSAYKIPKSFNFDSPKSLEPFKKFASTETLLFIFYSQPRTKNQIDAANALLSKGFTFDKFWKDQDGKYFNPELWKFSDAVN